MNFEQEIRRLCEEAVSCTSEAGAAELAKQAQVLIHARIEQLRGNLTPPPSSRENCIGLVVGAFLIDSAKKAPRPDRRQPIIDDSLEKLRKSLSEAHKEWARQPLLYRWRDAVCEFVKRSRTSHPNAVSATEEMKTAFVATCPKLSISAER